MRTGRFMYKSFLLSAIIIALFVGTVASVQAATLSVSPNTGVYTVGQTFTVNIRLNPSGQAINAAEGTLKFSPNKLEVVGLAQTGSIFNLWTVEPSFSNSAGTITFGGGSPRGYSGAVGTVLTATLRAKTAGSVDLSFTSGSILAADGLGTNVLSGMSGGTFTVSTPSSVPEPEQIIEYVAPANTPAAPVVSSATHPDQDAWYQNTTAELSWTVPSDVTAVRTGLTRSPQSVPSVVYDEPISSRTLEDLEQGVQYFHIQFRNEDGWGRVAHYRLAVDSIAPSDFRISLVDSDDAETFNPEPQLLFEVTEEESQIERYMIQLDGDDAEEFIPGTATTTVYQLPVLSPGRHTVVVEAIDVAGNSVIATFGFTVEAFSEPRFTELPEQIASDVIPVIKGETRPRSEVRVTVRRVDGVANAFSEQSYTVLSDERGVFTFIPDGGFDVGVYELQAVATDEYGAISNPSAPARLLVAEPGYVRLGTIALSVLSIVVPLVALTILLVLILILGLRRLRSITRYIRRETLEAEAVVAEAFSDLRNVLNAQADGLAETRKNKTLTKGELELVDTLTAELDSAEKRIRKEVSDVDDIV